jgi:hypothetical protein
MGLGVRSDGTQLWADFIVDPIRDDNCRWSPSPSSFETGAAALFGSTRRKGRSAIDGRVGAAYRELADVSYVIAFVVVLVAPLPVLSCATARVDVSFFNVVQLVNRLPCRSD